jgi:hypothetical protein
VGYFIHSVSSLTTGEYAILISSIEAKLDPKKFHCGTCITQYGSSPRLIGKSERKRRTKGCFDYTSKSYRIDNIRYTTCIGSFAVPIDFFVEAFSLYEKGVLPFKGGIGEQPNKIMEVFQLIEVRRSEKINQGK